MWFESIGGRVVVVDRTDTLTSGWFSGHGVTWAVQRPDFYLYGTATDATAASTLLSDLHSYLPTDQHTEGVAT